VIHVQPLLDLRDEKDIENLKNITDETFELVFKVRRLMELVNTGMVW
jgi:hypothetical protein